MEREERQIWLTKGKDNLYSRNIAACPTVILKLPVEHFGIGTKMESNLFSDMILRYKSNAKTDHSSLC